MPADALRIEADSVEVHHLTMVGTVPGVAPLMAAARNGVGTGALQCVGDGQLSWRAPGSATFGDPVTCSAAGQYVLADGEDPDKWIRVAVYVDYLVAGSQADVLLGEIYNNAVAGPDVTAAEAASGVERLYALSLNNAGADPIVNVRVWLDSAADPRISVSLDGVAWSNPSDEASALTVGEIAPGAAVSLHVRRSVESGASAHPRERVRLHFSFYG